MFVKLQSNKQAHFSWKEFIIFFVNKKKKNVNKIPADLSLKHLKGLGSVPARNVKKMKSNFDILLVMNSTIPVFSYSKYAQSKNPANATMVRNKTVQVIWSNILASL